MTTTLTDRYVSAALESLPEKQRRDIELELRASIADAVDDRRQAGTEAGDAEVQVLTELGDPARLAASYSERPLHLIGPVLYLDYVRLLKVLLSTVVPLLFVAVGIVQFLGGATPIQVVGGATATAAVAALLIAFWATLAFAIIERSPAVRQKPFVKWDPSSLPELPGRRVDVTEGIGGVVFFIVAACLVLLSQTLSPVKDAAGDPIGIIAPALWESGALYLVAFFAAARIVFDLVGYYVGWGVPHAVANSVLSILFVVPVVWLAANGLLVNDAFFVAVGWPQGSDVITWGVAIFAILTGLTDTIDGFVRARRSSKTSSRSTR